MRTPSIVTGCDAVPYDPASHPVTMLGVLIAAFTLLRLGWPGGFALARGGGGVTDSRGSQRSHSGDEHEGVAVAFVAAGAQVMRLGDRSHTWKWPATRAIDAVGRSLPGRLVRRSQVLARVAADGTYLRAILGSASLLAPLAGLALGVAAAQDAGGEALPPSAPLTIAIAALGIFDAAAGVLAVLAFTVGVLASGGMDSGADLRLLLGLGGLWFAVPLIAGAARPLRRAPARDLAQAWDRGADFVIASLVGAWAVQNIVSALPALAGVELEIASQADTIALGVLAALVIRLGFETLASHLYPKRLDVSEPGDLAEPGRVQRLAASGLRTVLFVFVAYTVVGPRWQLWVGTALFLAPQVLAAFDDRLPSWPGLSRVLPRGLPEIVVVLAATTAVALVVRATMDERSDAFLADAFVLLALPGCVLAVLALLGRDAADEPLGWGRRAAGVAVLAIGVALAVGVPS